MRWRREMQPWVVVLADPRRSTSVVYGLFPSEQEATKWLVNLDPSRPGFITQVRPSQYPVTAQPHDPPHDPPVGAPIHRSKP